MNTPNSFDGMSMQELFCLEVETQSTALTEAILALEEGGDGQSSLAELMRAAHSLKGAARIVGRSAAVRIAHAMEDCFVTAQRNNSIFPSGAIDTLLAGVDLLKQQAQISDEQLEKWEKSQEDEVNWFLHSLSTLASTLGQSHSEVESEPVDNPAKQYEASRLTTGATAVKSTFQNNSDRVLKVTATNLDHLMGLAGEGLLIKRWLGGFSSDLLHVKKLNQRLTQTLEALQNEISTSSLNELARQRWASLQESVGDCQRSLSESIVDLDLFDRRFSSFSQRLYHEVLDCRMRPFSDGIQGFQRLVRDLARSLNKTVRLEIKGPATPVDREILERLTAPLDHLIRNSLDHGLESSSERVSNGKPAEGAIKLSACHSAGMLVITLADDGRGIDPEAIKDAVIRRNLTTSGATQKMTHAELFEFLLLPGFSLKNSVSEISGRGVGLDVVQTMVKGVGGRVRISSRLGVETIFQLELPITLSVVRTLLVEISGEPYAFPLAKVERVLQIPAEQIESLQGHQHFLLAGEQIGLVAAHQVLELEQAPPRAGKISIVLLGDKGARYGLVIDRFLDERELVVRALDARLGKVKNISSAALMPDGSPVLVIDVDDLKRSIDNLASSSGIYCSKLDSELNTAVKRKRVLVVDDSLTVRELERKLLDSRGYIVDVAVDGMDGWNAIRAGHYDLIVTDVDMPRLDGIELLKLIRKDSRLKSMPVMIVSYKDRQEDRNRGLEAGADFYLTKASFHDETLGQIVSDLIGEAAA